MSNPTPEIAEDLVAYNLHGTPTLHGRVVPWHTPPKVAGDAEGRSLALARETLAGHPQGKEMPDLALSWLANRAELHAAAVLRLAVEIEALRGERNDYLAKWQGSIKRVNEDYVRANEAEAARLSAERDLAAAVAVLRNAHAALAGGYLEVSGLDALHAITAFLSTRNTEADHVG